MNTLIRITVLTTIFTAAALGQGALTPPGAPAPTMKSLLELWNAIGTLDTQGDETYAAVTALKGDARIPITAIPVTITQPGSYYLTGDFTVATGNAITVDADSVTLDLNGYTLSSTAPGGSGTAVFIALNRKNIRIANGTIAGTTTNVAGAFTPGGFIGGITTLNAASQGIHVSDIRMHGVAGNGIGLGNSTFGSSVVTRCTVNVAVGNGIVATSVSHCIANNCGDDAITGITISDSTGASVGTVAGDYGITGTTVTHCRGDGVAGHGINANVVSDSHGTGDSGAGIFGFVVTNCMGTSTSGTGIIAAQAVTNSYGTSSSGAAGIDADGTASFCRGTRNGGTAIDAAIAIGCTVSGNGTIVSPQKHLGTP